MHGELTFSIRGYNKTTCKQPGAIITTQQQQQAS